MLPVPASPKHKVLILGAPHFDLGSNASDWKPGKVVDMSSPGKQLGIEQVVEALKKFKSTRICIEWQPNQDSIFKKRHENYVSGKNPFGIGEYYQIRFRLAKAMGHEKYGIDNKPKELESPLAVDGWD